MKICDRCESNKDIMNVLLHTDTDYDGDGMPSSRYKSFSMELCKDCRKEYKKIVKDWIEKGRGVE